MKPTTDLEARVMNRLQDRTALVSSASVSAPNMPKADSEKEQENQLAEDFLRSYSRKK
jgi:hypothetical protein